MKDKRLKKKIKAQAKDFIDSRKNANNLVDILSYFNDDGLEYQPWMLAIESIFTDVLQKREMLKVSGQRLDDSSKKEYQAWLLECYDDALKKLLSVLETGEFRDQSQALTTLMNLTSLEGKYPLKPDVKEFYFPAVRLKDIVLKLLSSEHEMEEVITRLSDWSMCPDVRHYTWIALLPAVKKLNSPPDVLQRNIFALLGILLPAKLVNERKGKESDVPEPLCHLEGSSTFKFDEKLESQWLESVWKMIQKWKRKETLTHHKMLMLLLTKVLHRLSNPLPLTDLLFDSFEQGGSTSLLALQGIFILIQKHNLDYPNIYAKLYSLFEPTIFSMKYKARLFYLADIFLSSSHLPESMVASFTKRLSRLSLVAPPQDIVLIFAFVGNLMLRHPGLKKMVDSPGRGTVESDPFLPNEADPMQTRALESSLWEIKSLQSHMLPSVTTAARFIDRTFPTIEWDLEPLLEATTEKLFEVESKKRFKEVPLTFERPKLPCQPPRSDDVFTNFWRLS